MPPGITITLTILMGASALFFPARLAIVARGLDIAPAARTRAAIFSFVFLTGWFVLVLWGGLSGFFENPLVWIRGIPVPHLAYLSLAPLIAGALLIAFSPTARALLDHLKPGRVMLAQIARLIGAIFLVRYFMGDMPGAFALPAGIGDVLIGLTAPIIAWLYTARGDRVRGLAIAWNVLGMLDLVNALVLGFLAFGLKVFPGPETSPAGQPTAFPLILIPGYGVPLMMLVHIVTLRLLLRKPESAR